MKHILVPTDFSKPASIAFRYALQLAAEFDSQLTVFHAFHPNLDVANNYMVPNIEQHREIYENQMDNFLKENVPADTQVKVHSLLEVGFAGELIVDKSKANQYDYIVMGTTGSSGILDRFLGSVSTTVAQNASCPTIFVPASAAYRPIKDIVYASNEASTRKSMMDNIIALARKLEANIDFANAIFDEDTEQPQFQEDILENIFAEASAPLSFTMSTVKGEPVWNAILDHAKLKRADLIAVATKKRNWIEKLFHTSFTKNLVSESSDIPVIVYHYKD